MLKAASYFCAGALLAIGLTPVFAQIANSTIVGRITDPAGHAVANAAVELRRVETNEKFHATTTESGDYTASSLPFGKYDLKVAVTGFRAEIRTALMLDAGQTVRSDFALQIGTVAQSVDVSATTPVLNTETPATGATYGNEAIAVLPNQTRDIIQVLANITPSVLQKRDGGSSDRVSVEGQRQIDNAVYMDGALVSSNRALVDFFPNPDAFVQFEIKTSLYNAEYGIKPGGQMVLVTRSGTNQVHGLLFEQLRNNNLDARNFFDPGPRPQYKRNQFGGMVGGPIVLPKLVNGKDRLWFFFSYNGERVRNFVSLTGVVPTDAQRAGQFATPLIDPLSGRPFPGNLIPDNRLSPVAMKLQKFFPAPNTVGRAYNFTSDDSTANATTDQYIGKLDFRATDTDRWFARVYHDDTPVWSSNAISTFQYGQPLTTEGVTLSNTHTFANRYVNEAMANWWARPYYLTNPDTTKGYGATLGINGFPTRPIDYDGVPSASITGFLSVGSGGGGIVRTGGKEIRDSFSFSFRTHSFKLGYQWVSDVNQWAQPTRSSFAFIPRYTGQAYADFLLGFPSTATLGGESVRENSVTDGHYFYFQDDWKILPRLTIDIGLRYEYRVPYKDHRGFASNFDPATGALSPGLQNLTLQPWETGRFIANVPVYSYRNRLLQPRLGIAWKALPRIVVRAGAGIFANQPIAAMAGDTLSSNIRPGALSTQYLADATSPTISLSNPFNNSNPIQGAPLPNAYGVQSPLPDDRVYEWGLNIQTEINSQTVAEIAYHGSEGQNDYTQVYINDATPGAGNIQARRPYPNYQSILMLYANAHASREGMDVSIRHRAGIEGLLLTANFSYGRVFDVTGGRAATVGDPNFLSENVTMARNRGRGEGDNPGSFAAMATYNLPFGPKRQLLNHGIVSKIVSDWTLSGTYTALRGGYITAVYNFDRLGVGSTAAQRPDVLGNPNLPSDQRTPQRWFDIFKFVTPSLTSFGSAGRNIIEGPGLSNLDAVLSRSFVIGESARLNFHFDMFNATNHTNFLIPGNAFGTPTFGALTGAQPGRSLQFGLKLFF